MRINYFASVPYPEVTAGMEKLAEAGLGLEIEVVDPHWILEVCELPMVAKLGQTLQDRGFQVHVQGPFFDLAPGSLNPFIREHTEKLFLRMVEIAGSLHAKNLTFYSGYNPLLHSKVLDQWFEVCLPLWQETVEVADRYDLRILIANMFEEDPGIQLRLIEDCPPEAAGVCLDVANAFTYSRRKITSWLRAFSDRLHVVHLSDTRGKNGEHLPLGKGRVPLKEFFQECMKKNLAPDMVFKMTAKQSFESLQTLRKQGLGQYQIELL